MSIELSDVWAGYGGGLVLHGVTIAVPDRGLVAVLGRNGAGKTTLLRVAMGLLPPAKGEVAVLGHPVPRVSTEKLARAGVGYMSQEGGVFNSLTVAENLTLTGHPGRIDHVLTLFPALRERARQRAGTLSGGERKMLGLARVLAGEPKVCLLDEPTEGVWEDVVDDIGTTLEQLKENHAVLLVEQNLRMALRIADYVYVLVGGRVALEGTPDDIQRQRNIEQFVTI